jgi:hypothetical protein
MNDRHPQGAVARVGRFALNVLATSVLLAVAMSRPSGNRLRKSWNA